MILDAALRKHHIVDYIATLQLTARYVTVSVAGMEQADRTMTADGVRA